MLKKIVLTKKAFHLMTHLHNSLSASHTATFKCIGASHSVDYQDALKQVAELQKNGIETPVNIFCETQGQLLFAAS